MRSTRYDKFLPLLQELERIRNEDIGYDPVGYAENDRDKRLAEIETDLDKILGRAGAHPAMKHAKIHCSRCDDDTWHFLIARDEKYEKTRCSECERETWR